MNSNSTIASNDEVVDLEEYAKAGKPVPKARAYRFRVGKDKFTTLLEHPTGRQILEIAQKLPPEKWLLTLKKGKAMVKVELNDTVDLTEPGVERFMVVPKDQTEGETPAPRRQFRFPQEDEEAIESLGLCWEAIKEGQTMWLLIHGHPLPPGYAASLATVALRIPQNYPIEQLDMVYFDPVLVRVDGKSIGATGGRQTIDGRVFQQWSRHYTPQNPWQPGEFNVMTHLALVRHWLEREFPKAA